MACYHPLPAWRSKSVNPETGKRGITFSIDDAFVDMPLQLPCGTCIGCKMERARQWAMRCVHESQLYDSNAFVTLTYDDKHMPADGSLRPRDFVLFMKRARHTYPGLRFFQCGEYGENLGRPHHHAILFNCDISDRVFVKVGSSGSRLYSSRKLEGLWGFGYVWVGDCSFESAGYVARYAMKKVVGPAAPGHYQGRTPEYLTMSRRPGIGHGWALRYMDEWYASDSCIVNGVECKPPRYYDDLYTKLSASVFSGIKARRRLAAAESSDNTGSRLIVREAVKTSACSTLARNGVDYDAQDVFGV